MKDIFKFWKRQYSAVNTSESQAQTQAAENGRRASFMAGRRMSFDQRTHIIDSFFHKRKSGERTRVPKRVFILMSTALLAIVTAICIYIIQPYFAIFKWKLKFEENGEIYDLWARPPVDLYVKVYLFNITNKEGFLSGRDKKLNVQEVGPYVYKEVLSHNNVTFNSNGTLSTTPTHPLEWQEHLSEGNKEDDILTLPNIALLSIAQVAAQKSYFFRLPINIFIRQSKSEPLVEMTAKQFMFGYESPLTTLGNKFMPNWISFDKVGLIDRMYDFTGDFETFFTGEHDSSMSGLYDTYRGYQNLPQWDGNFCSNVSGASDGTKFQSFLEPNDTVLFFRKSLCRPIHMVRDGDNEYKTGGLKTYKYIFEENALDNGVYVDKNKCYCRKGECMPAGLIDVQDCYYGFPIVLSYPHFMEADPRVYEKIGGLEANHTNHTSQFYIQPLSGLPLSCSMKFQINMHLNDISSIAEVGNFSDITIPMLWFDIVMYDLPPVLKNRFHLYLNVMPVLDNLLFYGLFIGGIFMLILAISKVSFNISLSLSSPHNISKNGKFGNKGEQYKSNIYMPCEEKLINGEADKGQGLMAEPICTEMQTIDLKGISYELENELPLIESETESDPESEEQNTDDTEIEKRKQSENKVRENESFEAKRLSRRQAKEKRKFSWSIEPEMDPDLLSAFQEDGHNSLLHDDDELSSSTENLKEIIATELP